MHEQLATVVHTLRELAVSLAIVAGFVIGGYIIRKILFHRLEKWAARTSSRIDDIIISSLRGPLILWFLLIGISLGLEMSKYPERIVGIAQKVLLVLTILSITVVIASIVSKLVSVYSSRVETTLPVTSLTQNVSRLVVLAIGMLVILNVLGISITPILATLGVGGLAVALALQDTLANLFAGFHIIVSKQVRIGDYLQLESGQEGYVTDINWRTTKIKMLANNVVLIPNHKLAQVIVTNYYLPEKNMSVLVQAGVHYGSDLEQVERVTCEVGREVMHDVTGAVPEFDPFIRYHTFGDSSINFSVILRVNEYVDQYLVKHEFIKRLHERYAREGIVIPYPIRAINYDQEKKQ
jgi:small-conductance mechanosensitive channel